MAGVNVLVVLNLSKINRHSNFIKGFIFSIHVRLFAVKKIPKAECFCRIKRNSTTNGHKTNKQNGVIW